VLIVFSEKSLTWFSRFRLLYGGGIQIQGGGIYRSMSTKQDLD
jgi:hypothetical protein